MLLHVVMLTMLTTARSTSSASEALQPQSLLSSPWRNRPYQVSFVTKLQTREHVGDKLESLHVRLTAQLTETLVLDAGVEK